MYICTERASAVAAAAAAAAVVEEGSTQKNRGVKQPANAKGRKGKNSHTPFPLLEERRRKSETRRKHKD